MIADPEPPNAADLVVGSLRGHDVDRVYCLAGESYLPVLEALGRSTIDVVTCRHEAAAGFMALTDAKLTGRAGVFLVSRGPGITNAAVAVHAAVEDATPLIALVGGVPTGRVDREPFQEVDCVRWFGAVAKGTWTLHDADAGGELLARAFRTAESGTPGPVVVTLPEDILPRQAPQGAPSCRCPGAPATAAADDLDRVHRLLDDACRPLLIAGAGLDTPAGRATVRMVAERHELPVLTSNKQQHLIPNRHPGYAGHLHNATQPDRLAEFDRADLVLAVGTRLDTVTTRGYRFPRAPRPDQPLVHVHQDPARLGVRHRLRAGCAAEPTDFLRRLARWPAAHRASRRQWCAALHRREIESAVWHPVTAPDGVVFGAVAAALDELTAGEVTVTVDAGTFTSWIYRYLRFAARGRLIGISSSAMGFGLPAGIAAAMRSREVPTVVIVGDGGLLMNPGDLITACERRLPLVVVVANNSSYGTIRWHQERAYPGHPVGTELTNPDFARMAASFGALGLTARTDEQVRDCLAKALAHGAPAVVEIATSLRHLTAYRRLNLPR